MGIILFGTIEIIIGLVTLAAVIASLFFGQSAKPPNILTFVLATAALSLDLGIGILRKNLTSYRLLLFFCRNSHLKQNTRLCQNHYPFRSIRNQYPTIC